MRLNTLSNFFCATLLSTLVLGTGCDSADTADEQLADSDSGSSNPASDQEPSGSAPEAKLCERAYECGYGVAGYSIGDCTDIVSECTGDLLTSAKQDWNNDAQVCLGLNNCQNFGDCFDAIDVCVDVFVEEVAVDDPSGAGGDPGNADSGASDDGDGGEGGDGSSFPNDDSCIDGDRLCLDEETILFCDLGEPVALDCVSVCDDSEISLGCGTDDLGVDYCFCE